MYEKSKSFPNIMVPRRITSRTPSEYIGKENTIKPKEIPMSLSTLLDGNRKMEIDLLHLGKQITGKDHLISLLSSACQQLAELRKSILKSIITPSTEYQVPLDVLEERQVANHVYKITKSLVSRLYHFEMAIREIYQQKKVNNNDLQNTILDAEKNYLTYHYFNIRKDIAKLKENATNLGSQNKQLWQIIDSINDPVNLMFLQFLKDHSMVLHPTLLLSKVNKNQSNIRNENVYFSFKHTNTGKSRNRKQDKFSSTITLKKPSSECIPEYDNLKPVETDISKVNSAIISHRGHSNIFSNKNLLNTKSLIIDIPNSNAKEAYVSSLDKEKFLTSIKKVGSQNRQIVGSASRFSGNSDWITEQGAGPRIKLSNKNALINFFGSGINMVDDVSDNCSMNNKTNYKISKIIPDTYCKYEPEYNTKQTSLYKIDERRVKTGTKISATHQQNVSQCCCSDKQFDVYPKSLDKLNNYGLLKKRKVRLDSKLSKQNAILLEASQSANSYKPPNKNKWLNNK